MCANIVFPGNARREEIIISTPSSVIIESSYKLLTDKAEIIVPRNEQLGPNRIREIFRRGDRCIIFLGYNGEYQREFTGYVTEVSATIPVRLKLEDEMWQLKQLPVSISLKQTTLENLLRQILPGHYAIDALEIGLGTVRFPNTSVSKILGELQKEFGLYTYMKGQIVVCGKIFADDELQVTDFNFTDTIIGDSLEYREAGDTKILIKAISITTGGQRTSVEVGDKEGELRQLTYYNVGVDELKKLATLDLQKSKIDGYKGVIETFGLPFLHHGSKVRIIDPEYPEREGVYYTESIKTIFDNSPMYHRKIQLASRVTT